MLSRLFTPILLRDVEGLLGVEMLMKPQVL